MYNSVGSNLSAIQKRKSNKMNESTIMKWYKFVIIIEKLGKIYLLNWALDGERAHKLLLFDFANGK